MSIAIGYMPGAFGEGGDNPNYLRQLVEAGDKHGYDSIWLSDRIVSEKFSLEAMTACAMVAAYSDKLKFGTSVIAMPLRNPVVLAKQIATLDFLSQGRFFPAVGLGQEEPEEYEACGVSKERRGPRTDEAIQLMRRLWEEEDVTHEGRVLHLPQRLRSRPSLSSSRPRRCGLAGAPPPPPGGWAALATAGWSPAPPPLRSRMAATSCSTRAEEFNRVIEDDHVGVLMGYYVSNDVEEATIKANQFVTRQRPDVHFTEFTAVGPVDRIAEYVHRYVESGASKFVVRPSAPPTRRWINSTSSARSCCPSSTSSGWRGRQKHGNNYRFSNSSKSCRPIRFWEGPFVVDTGAVDCVVPRQHLEGIGLTPEAVASIHWPMVARSGWTLL